MNCSCHQEPMYWNRDLRKRAGGFYYCAVKARDRSRRVYDADPIHRISKQLQHASYQRGRTLERMEKAHGSLQTER